MAASTSTLPPIPGSPPLNPDALAAPNPSSTLSTTSRGPRPTDDPYALPIPEQIRALLQSKLAVTLPDGRLLRGTLTSVDSTSVLLTNVEELREIKSENVRTYYPWSKDGINAGWDGEAEAASAAASAAAAHSSAGTGTADVRSGKGGPAGHGSGGSAGGQSPGAEGQAKEREGGTDAGGLGGEAGIEVLERQGQVGGGGPTARVRRRELQSILVQFAHCVKIELDEENHTAWRRYCEMPVEMQARHMMGQVI